MGDFQGLWWAPFGPRLGGWAGGNSPLLRYDGCWESSAGSADRTRDWGRFGRAPTTACSEVLGTSVVGWLKG